MRDLGRRWLFRLSGRKSENYLMENFTPFTSLIGGFLIGLSATLLLWCNGRISGISSIAGGLLTIDRAELGWRILFLIGLVGGVGVYRLFDGSLQEIEITTSLPLLVGGGLLVGIGTRMGGGCTSGHSVCGIARFSTRSIVATITFMTAAGLTIYVVRHLLGAG